MTPTLHALIYTLIAVVMLTGVGNWVCCGVFWLAGLRDSPANSAAEAHPAGWIIGWLERIVLAIGIVTQSWEVLAAVIALKSVARFKDLDDRRFAEYFLVGSLFSIFWAILITGSWLAYDHRFGIDVRATIAGMIALPEASGGH